MGLLPNIIHPFCLLGGHSFTRHGDVLVCSTCGKRVVVKA